MSEPHRKTPEDVEAFLRGMSWQTPSGELDRRILGERPSFARRFLAPALAATLAAGVTVALFGNLGAKPGAPNGPSAVGLPDAPGDRVPDGVQGPLRIERVWQAERDDGVVGLSNEGPVRRIQRQSVQRLLWVDPETERSIQMIVPRRETVLIRAETY